MSAELVQVQQCKYIRSTVDADSLGVLINDTEYS